MGVLCTSVKLLTDLQILGCELQTVGMERDGGLDLDICPGTPEFLVTKYHTTYHKTRARQTSAP